MRSTKAGRLTCSDEVFPTFIIEQMPHGLAGLIVAAIIAATMSTHSGAINSLAAATTHDIYLPLTGRQADDPRTLRAGKLFALVWGIGLTLGALLFKQQGTPVVVMALGIASFTYGALGRFLPRHILAASPAARRDPRHVGRHSPDGLRGLRTATSAAYPALTRTLGPMADIAWPWYVLIGTSITMLVGVVSSCLVNPQRRSQAVDPDSRRA